MNNISWWRTSFGEEDIRRITESIASDHISQGAITAEFEARIATALDIPYVVATTSGSVAILMALMALGIKRDDEVILPNRAWIAAAHAVMMLGAKTVLVDVLPDRPIMDVSLIREKITPQTRAIIPVPMNGRAIDMEEVWKIADEYGLFVIEDAAQALFSKNLGKYMGTQSDVGCFSLSVAKLIPTGQGGFVVTRKKEIYEKLRRIRTHGVDDVINCTFHQMGFNFRFTDIQASIGLSQLDRVEKRVGRLNDIYARYESGIRDILSLKLIPVNISCGEIPIYVEVLCKERKRLISFLASRGIQTRPFYPDLNFAEHLGILGEFPNARIFGEQGMMLPCGPDQPFENIDHVMKVLGQFERNQALPETMVK